MFGFIPGLLLPFVLGALLYILNEKFALNGQGGGLQAWWFGITHGIYLFSPFIRLATLINLGLFFLMLRLNKELAARGVLIATILWGIYIIFIYMK
ncbi:MAG: hypothetical protein JNK73_02580 [Bacteroidia bacterium]|nr:hypothetical protein [Bacteroidia bacterium]